MEVRKIINLCLVTISILLFTGCNSNLSKNSDIPVLLTGSYEAVGDYEETKTPYFYINIEKKEFLFAPGSWVSYAVPGTYEVKNGEIIATSPKTTYIFKIIDAKTLKLIDNGDDNNFRMPVDTQFLFIESK